MKTVIFILVSVNQLLLGCATTTEPSTVEGVSDESTQHMKSLLANGNLPPPPTDQLRYLEFTPMVQQQAILPQLTFTTHGTITSYSALTVLVAREDLINFLAHSISFTVLRPRGQGLYDVVGHNVLKFSTELRVGGIVTIDNSTGLVPEDLAFFRFTNKEPELEEVVTLPPNGLISFQPGDILGWNQFGHTVVRALSLVYRESAADGYDGFTLSPAEQPQCSVSVCGARNSNLSSIIPYLSVHYVETAPNASQILCESPTSQLLMPCEAPSTTSNATTATTTAPTPQSSINIIVIVAPIVVTVGALLLLIALTMMFLLCYKAKKRERYLVKLQKGSGKYQLEDNPRYGSATDGVIHENNHHQSTDKLHFEAEDGGLYAIPSNVRREPENVRRTTNLEELFDGECYATTYQSNNGQCHIYQELPEASLAAKQRARSTSMVASHEVLSHSRPPIPLRITASSASVSNFPYTMPNTPALSVFDLETKPSVQVFPYTESRPNTSYSDRKSTSSPYVESIPSLAGSSETKPSTTSTLPFTPEDTPPSSATIEGSALTVRKLFHAVDEELMRVPNALERQEMKMLDNPDEIYSKLKHSYSNQNRDSVDVVFLDQPDQFWFPPSDPTELYDQLAKRKFREIQRKQIRVTDCIGGGNFGTVYKGLWKIPGGVMGVAVKMLNPNCPDGNEIKFLKEAAIMGQFLHTNVVKLLGVVTVGEPLMIVLELMPKGDLKQYLRSLDYASSMIKEDLPTLLLGFCRQIGYGMNYLANKAFVHRDLAARNILLAEDLTCKIGDFGMSRDLEEETVYFSQGGKLPVRWSAPEALKYHHFSSASDVWSYGMLLFEIWSLGKKPFEGILTKRLMTLVYSGFCQPPPPGCPRAIYKMMVDCWHTEAEKRTTFAQICSYLNSSSTAGSLLAWRKEDSFVSPRARELGASLSASKRLYVDLQFTYTNSLV